MLGELGGGATISRIERGALTPERHGMDPLRDLKILSRALKFYKKPVQARTQQISLFEDVTY